MSFIRRIERNIEKLEKTLIMNMLKLQNYSKSIMIKK